MNSPDGFADAFDTSLTGPAFSNGHEGEAWMAAWCGSCSNSDDDGDGCCLTDVALIGRIPADWIELDRGSLANRYLCLGWTPRAGYVGAGDTGNQLADVLGQPRMPR